MPHLFSQTAERLATNSTSIFPMCMKKKKPQTKYQLSVDDVFIEKEYGLCGMAGKCKPIKLYNLKTCLFKFMNSYLPAQYFTSWEVTFYICI